jgi:hypothetical protein
MNVGTYVDGRALVYDHGRNAFAVGDAPVTIAQVRAYADAGQITWANEETRVWFDGLVASQTPPAAANVTPRKRPNAVVAFLAVAILLVCGFACFMASRPSGSVTPGSSSTAPPAQPSAPAVAPKVDAAKLLAALKLDWREDITDVKVQDDGTGDVRIDIYTVYYPDSDVVDHSRGMAAGASTMSLVSEAYPKVSVDAYVWPASKAFYMVRTSSSWTNGRLDAPFDIYVNDVLK